MLSCRLRPLPAIISCSMCSMLLRMCTTPNFARSSATILTPSDIAFTAKNHTVPIDASTRATIGRTTLR